MKRATIARIVWGPVVLASMVLIVAVWQSHTAAQQRRAADLPQPVVDNHELMELFNKPLYQYMKQSMQPQPETDEQWQTIADRGLQTAELANLVAIRDGDPQWLEHSARLQRAGLDLAEAAAARNWETTMENYQTLIQRCNDCHQATAPDHAPQLKP